MKSSRRAVAVFVVMGMAVGLALLEYGSVGAVGSPAVAAKTETKLEKALKACKKDKPKSKRVKCEKAARKKYPPGTKTTGTTTGTTMAGTTTAGGTTAGGTTAGGTTAGGTTAGAITTTTAGATGTTAGATTGNKEAQELKELEMAKSAKQNLLGPSEVGAGGGVFQISCSVCHGSKGEGASGDNYASYDGLARAQTVEGVIDQLIRPDLGMPNVGETMKFAEKEDVADYICVKLVMKCEESH